jgi:hypothetical protein
MKVPAAEFELDPAYQLELIKGAEPEDSSLFLDVFGRESVGTMSGKIPFIPDEYTLLGAETNSKVGREDDPDVIELGNSSAAFSFDHKYAKEARIHNTRVETLARLEGGKDLVEYLGAVAKGMAYDAFERDGASILRSPTLNETISANDTWTSNNENPDDDFNRMADKVGEQDLLLWIGLNKMRELQQSDAYKDADKNYSGSNSWVSEDRVVEQIKSNNPVREVVVGRKWYQADDVAQGLNKARIFDDVIWMGTPDHVIPVERPELMTADNEFQSRSGKYCQWVTMYLDIARADTQKGVVLQGA